MFRMRLTPCPVTVLIFVTCLSCCRLPELRAQGPEPSDADDASRIQDISVPDGTPEQLLEFIQRIQADRPTAKSRARFVVRVTIAQEAILATADKILASDAKDDVMLQAVKFKFGALSLLGRVGKRQARQRTLDFAESLKGDTRAGVADEAARQTLIVRLANLNKTNAAEKSRLIQDLNQFLAEKPVQERLAIAASGAGLLEDAGAYQLAARAYTQFAKTIARSRDPMLAAYGPKFEGAARRMMLVGHVLRLEGNRADGTPLDWDAYRGRVVLVDFWATWCRPCLRELPNIKDHYSKYHDRGFEVVGINLDSSQRKLKQFVLAQKIPWVNLSASDPDARGIDHPMAIRYGVLQIPTSILVDQDGKVLSLKARGTRLTELLEQHLGAPAEANASPTPSQP